MKIGDEVTLLGQYSDRRDLKNLTFRIVSINASGTYKIKSITTDHYGNVDESDLKLVQTHNRNGANT